MDSVITEYGNICVFCGKPRTGKHHLIFGKAERALADEDGLLVPVCDNCHTIGQTLSRIHDNPMAEKLSKIVGQLAWEKEYLKRGEVGDEREAFRLRYGKSYL